MATTTYYAEYVRIWYEMDIPYLAAAVETGLYLLLPLTILTLGREWWAHRDLTYALSLLCIGLHTAYIARIGGRPFRVSSPRCLLTAVGDADSRGHRAPRHGAGGNGWVAAPGCGMALCCKSLDIRAGSVSVRGIIVDPLSLCCDLMAVLRRKDLG